jgi:molybdopterin-synthase adenylyltransferase
MDFERYSKNMKTFSIEELKNLFEKKVCILGCGGLGGYVIQILSRFGIKHLTIVDGDSFAISNLNRQVFSDVNSIGMEKVTKVKRDLEIINPDIKVNPIHDMLNINNAYDILCGHDVVVDCLDNIDTRILVQDVCEDLNIPFVHGAIASFYGQVTTIFPGDKTLNKIYKKGNIGVEKELGNPSFIPPYIASIQACEVIKFLNNKGDLLRNKILYIDLLNNEFETIEL